MTTTTQVPSAHLAILTLAAYLAVGASDFKIPSHSNGAGRGSEDLVVAGWHGPWGCPHQSTSTHQAQSGLAATGGLTI